jgi:sulfur carrier protein ThiS
MSVKLTYRKKEYEVRAGSTLRHAIESIGLAPDAVLCVKEGELITDDAILEEGDEIKLVAVISGGRR